MMPRHPCEPGCTCGKHKGGFSGHTHSDKARKAMSDKVKTNQAWKNRDVVTWRAAIRSSWNRLTPEQYAARCKSISDGGTRSRASGRYGWTGGEAGIAFAAVLCPVGYVQEYQVNYGPGPRAHYKLDFAHPVAKVDIELDGPYHDLSKDAERDARLRALGWKVIRIRHE